MAASVTSGPSPPTRSAPSFRSASFVIRAPHDALPVLNIWKTSPIDDYADASIALALKVRAAMALGDYCTLFRLYGEAPTHAQHVMDTFTDRARLDAVKVLLKGYVPTVPLTFVAQNLGFDGDAEAAEFLEDHGCVVPPIAHEHRPLLVACVFVPEVAVHGHRNGECLVVHAAVLGQLLRTQPF